MRYTQAAWLRVPICMNSKDAPSRAQSFKLAPPYSIRHFIIPKLPLRVDRAASTTAVCPKRGHTWCTSAPWFKRYFSTTKLECLIATKSGLFWSELSSFASAMVLESRYSTSFGLPFLIARERASWAICCNFLVLSSSTGKREYAISVWRIDVWLLSPSLATTTNRYNKVYSWGVYTRQNPPSSVIIQQNRPDFCVNDWYYSFSSLWIILEHIKIPLPFFLQIQALCFVFECHQQW